MRGTALLLVVSIATPSLFAQTAAEQGAAALAADLEELMIAHGKSRGAILPGRSVDGRVTAFGTSVAATVRSHLSRSGAVEAIENAHIGVGPNTLKGCTIESQTAEKPLRADALAYGFVEQGRAEYA